MQRKTKSVIACGMAAALMLTTLGMENEVSAKAAPKMQTKVLSLKKGQKKTIRIKGKGILKTTWKTTKKIITLTKKKKNKVTVAGKKIGTAVVVAKVKTKKKNYHLKCKVKVARAQGAKKTNVTNTKVPQTTKNPRKTESTPTVTPAATQDNTSKTEPSDTAQPSQTPASDVPEGYEEIDLSTCRMNNASEAGSYDSETKTLHIQDAENFQFPLKENINKGEVLSVMLKGTYHGTKGFRSWLVDDSQTTNSNIFNTNDEVGFTGGEIELLYDLEATTAAGQLFFKGPSYGVNIDDLEISKIYVKYTVSAGEKKSYDPYTPSKEQDANTDNLQLTKSFSEQKGMIGNNPLITQDFMADPTAVEYDGRLYVFGTADKMETDSKGNVISNSYNTCELRCISSADLVNWTDHGTIKVNEVATWAKHSWAPTICKREEKNGTMFYLYFANGGDGIGVLRSKSPLGPWEDPSGKRLISRDTPNCSSSEVPWLFDPAVLVDDDGTGYLYFGGGTGTDSEHPKSARVVKLGEDMCSLVSDPEELDPYYLFEDSEINKINGTYVYSYCTNWKVPSGDETTGSCCIAFMTSDKPMSGFEYQKQLFANPGSVFGNYYNNHHKLIQFKGQWYIIYHTTMLEETAYGTKQGYRTLHMDKLNVGEDSNGKLTIEAKATYGGLSAVVQLNPYIECDASTMAWNGGLRTKESESQNKMVVDSIHTGDWLGVSSVDFSEEGANCIRIQAASEKESGKIEVWLDGPEVAKNGKKVAEVDVKPTGGGDVYEEIRANLAQSVTGEHDVYFVFRGKDYHISSWRFEK